MSRLPPPSMSHLPPFNLPAQIKAEDSPRFNRVSSPDRHLSRSDDEDLNDGVSPSGGSHSKPRERRPHATRRRVVQSCSECRRRKIKCDKKFPCGPCILRSDQDRCHEVGMAEKNVVSNSSNLASTSDLALLAHRLDALEAALVKSGALIPADLEHYLKSSRMSIAQDTRQNSPQPGPPPASNVEMDDIEDTEGAARVLERLAFGRSRVDGNTAVPYFGARQIREFSPDRTSRHLPVNLGRDTSPSKSTDSGYAALSRSVMGFPPTLGEEERNRRTDDLLDLLGPTDVVNIFFKQTDVVLKLLVKILPNQEIAEVLVKTYLEKVDWLHRCMHVPSFMKMCRDIWKLDRPRVVHEIPLSSVALYMTVCLLGLMFMDTADAAKMFTPEELRVFPDLWYNSVRSALWAADFMACHTVEAIQCVILLMVYMKNRDRSDAAWAMLGAIIKMAQGLGLSRLGSEQQASDTKSAPVWVGRWKSLVEREVGRRIWWNLVWLDWALAPSYNYACCITPDQIKTAMPANVNDEDLADDRPFRPQPTDVYTKMSFQLARLKFAEIGHRQIWAANNTNAESPYAFTLTLDGELRRAMMDLPSFYQPDPSRRSPEDSPLNLIQFYERTMLNLAVHARMMRLHRPWLSKGYTDERFAYSKEQCIRAARANLRMMGNHNASASFLEKWWLPLFYVSVSGLVVIIDLLRTPKRDLHSNETEQEIQEVRGALDQMRRIADVSHPSRAAVKILDLLMEEIEDRRKPTLGKRKLPDTPDGDDDKYCLQRAVKKLIRQAQFETDSSAATSPVSAKSPQPKTGREIDMRIFSDTPRDRPLFDAYPLPQPQPQPPSGNNEPAVGAEGGLQAPAPRNQGVTSPFQFPADSNLSFGFPTDPAGGFQPPAPNPVVENMLASYFPPTNPAPIPQTGMDGSFQAPEDFLSKVFNFGWDPAGNAEMSNQPMNDQSGRQGTGDMNGNAFMSSMPTDTWNSHGWMA